MIGFQQHAERLTGALSDPGWTPRRSHIEGARNSLAKAGADIAKTVELINDLERHGTLDHGIAFELRKHLDAVCV